MKRHSLCKLGLLCSLLFALPVSAVAQALEYRSVWLPGGNDADEIMRTSDWYKAVLGMLEVQRFGTGRGVSLGVGMKFGASLQEAKASPGLVMGIAKSFAGEPGGAGKDPTPRVSFNVTQLNVLLQRVTDFGGKVVSQPRQQGRETVVVVADSFGNLVELVAQSNDAETIGRPKVTWRTLRFPAVDPEKSAGFYQRVLNMTELSRSGPKNKPEILMNFGKTVEEAKASKEVPITIAYVDDRARPLLTTFASQLAMGFTEYATMRDTLNRAYAEGTAFLSDPHYIAPIATFARFLDPDGTYLELAGRCNPADVGTTPELATFLCGPAK